MPRLYRRRSRSTVVKKLFLVAGFLFLAGLVGIGVTAAVMLKNLPAPEYLFSRRVAQSTKILDRTNTVLLYEIHGEEKRTVISFEEIPQTVKDATIAVEDANFYRHRGIDFRGIARAAVKDVASRDFSQGGSTITQQLVKNSLLSRERTIARKLKEVVLAIALESRLEKEKILDLYLNQIPYGQNAYGIEAAAQTYFGKHARDLSTAEAATLAALPRAPSYYSPYGQHKDELLKRKDLTIDRMQELGYLDAVQTARARSEVIKFAPAAKNIQAPHFAMFVRDYLIERYGEEEIEKGGLIVTTALDWKLQDEAEKIVRQNAAINEKLIKAKNMAVVAVNPKNGDILAMVGSRDYFDIQNDGNFNVATALRQPGSAFKPFVYATAFRKGFRPQTVLFDVPTEFHPDCDPGGRPRPGKKLDDKECYHPQNFDEKFRGPVTLHQALAQSLNVPSVKLLYLAGVEDSIRTAEEMGITTLGDRQRFGLSLVLGGAEIKLLEMTNAFGVFANDGVFNAPRAVLKVETTDGKVLEESRDSPRLVLDPEIVHTINDILSDNAARVPTFAPNSPLYFSERKVAVKTGTTQDYRDAWTVGYAPNVAVGVWVGNNDNSSIQQKGSGVLAAAPTWRAVMEAALQDLPPEEFPPANLEESPKPVMNGVWQGDTITLIDTVSGKLATDLTPPEKRKYVAYGEPRDPLFWIDRRDPSGPSPEDPGTDPQYPNWDAAFKEWLKQSGFQPLPVSAGPKDYDDVHTVEKQPKLEVKKSTTENGAIILEVKIDAPWGVKEVILLSQERILDMRRGAANVVKFIIPTEDLSQDQRELEVKVYDTVGNIGTQVIALS